MNYLTLLMLIMLEMSVQGQKTNYSEEYMTKVKKYSHFTYLKGVVGDPATGLITITFDRYWRDKPCGYTESWGVKASDNTGTEYKETDDYSAPTYQGMWTRVILKGKNSFVVNRDVAELTNLKLRSLWCGKTPGTHDYVNLENVKIKWMPYDTIYPAWSAESYASNGYMSKGAKVIPYTGRTECMHNLGAYIPFRLIGLVGNSQTGVVTLILSAHAMKGGNHTLTIERLSAFDDDGNHYEKNYGYQAESLPLVNEIDREIRCVAFQVPVNTSSFQRVEIECKSGAFDNIKYRCDDVSIQWVFPNEEK